MEEKRTDPGNARIFTSIMKRKHLIMISDGHEFTQVKVKQNYNTILRKFRDKLISKDNTMTESDLQRVYNYYVCLRDSKITTNKRFVNIGKRQLSDNHWTCSFL